MKMHETFQLSKDVKTLITLFNTSFKTSHSTLLVCCEKEPIYRPADKDYPLHRIIFAHGFFASALHEIAHWCIAGQKRRLLEDFGYWYQPDGRSAAQQLEFERVEVKPQALEWIFSVASNHLFHFSADNLEANLSISEKFQLKVYQQVKTYLTEGLPKDADLWTNVLLRHYRSEQPLRIEEFKLIT